jgi:hypothetical protein
MPTILDATVVASAYTTSASARPQKLSNGWIVSAVYDSVGLFINFYVTKNNFATTPVLLCKINAYATGGFSIAVKGTRIFLVNQKSDATVSSFTTFDAMLVAEGSTVSLGSNLDISQTALGNVSLAINDTGTELHATWASKNATYPNSFNLRYVKGTINADGSVTWGAVQQLTNSNTTGQDYTNPTITLNKNGNPVVIAQHVNGSGSNNIYVHYYNGSAWMNNFIYNGGTYAQSSPNAIFVPQSINGLANGRIWVAWHGGDATNTYDQVRVAYSDDGGVTWIVQGSLTVGSIGRRPTLTANKYNEIFVLYTTSVQTIEKIKNINGTWGSKSVVVSVNTPDFPSALYDPTFGFTEPLFIYKGASKVGFYGTWTVTTISVTQGSIGQKTDKTNLLTYVITTDGVMSTITEKINGTVTGTKTATSGQSLIAGVTQAQWDAVRFGKYDFVNNDKNLQNSALWEQGNISNMVGSAYSPATSTTRIRVINAIVVNPSEQYLVNLSANHQIFVFEYNASGQQVNPATGWFKNEDSITLSGTTTSIRTYIQRVDGATITPTESTTAQLLLKNSKFLSNTLTVEMGSEVFTYTFDKRPATDADILSATKAIQDARTTYLPAVKAKLASSIRGKGGVVNDTDSIEVMASAVGSLPVKRSLSGNGTSSSTSSSSGYYASGTSTTFATLSVTGLPFKPSKIVLERGTDMSIYTEIPDSYYSKTVKMLNFSGSTSSSTLSYNLKGDAGSVTVTNNSFVLPVYTASASYTWTIYE